MGVADRLLWAVDMMDIQPEDRLLEIGCGRGVAIALVYEHLKSGSILAIDRSEKMIAAAQKQIDDTRVTFEAVALSEINVQGKSFDTIFAVNVNVFWQQPEKELEVVKQLLASEGMLYLFYQPPSSHQIQEIVEKVKNNFQRHNLKIIQTSTQDLPSGRTVCIQACYRVS
jgi:ubiquinone/menaquinone biosynthesis C-methylase UbiE